LKLSNKLSSGHPIQKLKRFKGKPNPRKEIQGKKIGSKSKYSNSKEYIDKSI